MQQKSSKIAGQIREIANLKRHTNELERQLQAETQRAERLSSYQKAFKQTGTQFLQKLKHQQLEQQELEEKLSGLRESQAETTLSYLIKLGATWNGSEDIS